MIGESANSRYPDRNLTPLFAVVVAAFLFNEVPRPLQALSIAMIVITLSINRDWARHALAPRGDPAADRAPETLGPMRRLASNVSNVTVAGNNRPTRTKINAPRGSHPSQSSMNGASAENSTAEVGMLTDAPRLGGTWRRPNWVSTSARPKRKEAHSANTCGFSSKSQPLTSGAASKARLCDQARPKNW